MSSGEIVKIRAKMTYNRYQAKSSPIEVLYEWDKANLNDAAFRVSTMVIWDIKEVKLVGGRFVCLMTPFFSYGRLSGKVFAFLTEGPLKLCVCTVCVHHLSHFNPVGIALKAFYILYNFLMKNFYLLSVKRRFYFFINK